jgi:hypothetical protein
VAADRSGCFSHAILSVTIMLWMLGASAPARAQDDLPEGSEPAGSEGETKPAKPAATVDRPPQSQTSLLSKETMDRLFPQDVVKLTQPYFSENANEPRPGWTFDFHGYARMPVRLHQPFTNARAPYLVDDSYYNSGFSYLRVNETEYAEMNLSIEHERTRAVIGLLVSGFSDWSQVLLQNQQGVATAFVEHTWKHVLIPDLDISIRAGMFWDRYGYSVPYDTYLLGRLHVGGTRIQIDLLDMFYLKAGFGAHLDLRGFNQGFTPVDWFSVGANLGFLDVSLFYAYSWNKDTPALSVIQQGSLRSIGAEVRAVIPYVGPLFGSIASYRAANANFVAPALEILHSQGGVGFTQNFLGPDSDNGTGEATAYAFGLTWQPYLAAQQLFGAQGRSVRGLDINFFGMIADVASNQASTDPLKNFYNRWWIKWGVEPFYRPPFENWQWFFVALRFDRVILDKDHNDLAFRVLTPKIGVTPVADWKLDIFISHSQYSYGGAIQLRPNQIQGDQAATIPDASVWKLQAQVLW